MQFQCRQRRQIHHRHAETLQHQAIFTLTALQLPAADHRRQTRTCHSQITQLHRHMNPLGGIAQQKRQAEEQHHNTGFQQRIAAQEPSNNRIIGKFVLSAFRLSFMDNELTRWRIFIFRRHRSNNSLFLRKLFLCSDNRSNRLDNFFHNRLRRSSSLGRYRINRYRKRRGKRFLNFLLNRRSFRFRLNPDMKRLRGRLNIGNRPNLKPLPYLRLITDSLMLQHRQTLFQQLDFLLQLLHPVACRSRFSQTLFLTLFGNRPSNQPKQRPNNHAGEHLISKIADNNRNKQAKKLHETPV